MRSPVLITGLRGFVGRALSRRLAAAGMEVHGTTRRETTDAEAAARLHFLRDMSMPSLAKVAADVRPETIFHLAFGIERVATPAAAAEYVSSTLQSAANLLEAVQSEKPTVVLLGSGEEYGAAEIPYDETSAERPLTSYGLAKLAVTALGRQLRAERDWPLVTVRPSVVYGPGQAPESFMGRLASAFRGERLGMSPGDQTRDFVHVEDLVDALLLVANSPQSSDVVNASSGVEISLKEVADLAAHVAGRPLFIDFGAFPYRHGDSMRYVLSPTRLRESYGWRSRVSLETGLRELLEEASSEKHHA